MRLSCVLSRTGAPEGSSLYDDETQSSGERGGWRRGPPAAAAPSDMLSVTPSHSRALSGQLCLLPLMGGEAVSRNFVSALQRRIQLRLTNSSSLSRSFGWPPSDGAPQNGVCDLFTDSSLVSVD